MLIRKNKTSTSLVKKRCHRTTILLAFISMALVPLVTSELCSVFVLNLDDPETYSRRNVNCSNRGVKNEICCSGICCPEIESQLFKIETVDGFFRVEKSESNMDDLFEIVRKGKTIFFQKLNPFGKISDEDYRYWKTIIIVIPCVGILVIIICIVLCCFFCSCCPCSRKARESHANQGPQAAPVVQIPMQYLSPRQPQQEQSQAYAYPRQQMLPQPQAYHPPSPQQTYQPPSQQQTYHPSSQQQAYQPPSQQQAYQPPSQQQAYQPPSQQQAYQPPPQQLAYPAERDRLPSVGFQPLTPKPQRGEPSQSDAPSAPFPT